MGYFQYFQHLPTSWALKGGPMWEALAGFSKSFQYSEKQSCRHFKWGSLSDTLHCDKSAWRSLRPKQTSCIDPANGTWSAATCCNIEWLVSTPTDVLLKATVYGGNGAWKESDYRIGMNEAACHRPSNPARDLDLQYWLELNFALNHSLMLQGELAQPLLQPLLSCSPIEPNHQCARLRRRQAESPVRRTPCAVVLVNWELTSVRPQWPFSSTKFKICQAMPSYSQQTLSSSLHFFVQMQTRPTYQQFTWNQIPGPNLMLLSGLEANQAKEDHIICVILVSMLAELVRWIEH